MRLKTLNGAPLSEHLDFNDKTLKEPGSFEPAIGDFLNGVVTWEPKNDDFPRDIKWRRLDAQDTRLRSGLSQPYLPGGTPYEGNSSISFSIANLETSPYSDGEGTVHDEPTDITHSLPTDTDDFLEHSIILHDTLLSSQLALDPDADKTLSSSSFLSTSFETATTEQSKSENKDSYSTEAPIPVPSTLIITPLKNVPSCKELRDIYPQTPTPNLLCVLISLTAAREVLIKKSGQKMELHEIAVADDTRSNFKVSFWLRPVRYDDRPRPDTQQSIRQTLEQAKAGDILLLRNIALSAFRDEVYGQSLSASIARVRTTAHIVMRAGRPSSFRSHALPATVLETVMRLKKWANAHIVTEDASSRKRKRNSRRNVHPAGHKYALRSIDDSLPPDTLDS